LINVLVYNNSASSQGAVFNKGNNEIVNSTIVSNNGAIYYDNDAAAGADGELEAYNTIFAGDFNAGTDSFFNTSTVNNSILQTAHSRSILECRTNNNWSRNRRCVYGIQCWRL